MLRFLLVFVTTFITSLSLQTVESKAEAEYAIDFNFNGIKSRYTAPLAELSKNWPSQLQQAMPDEKTKISIDCYSTPGNNFYIGARQQMLIRAPFVRVEALLDNFNIYPQIFEDLVKVVVLEKNKNKFLTFWEQYISFPFAPNEKTEMYYVWKKFNAGKKIYRYQLKKSNNLKFNDGLIVIEKKSNNETVYTEYDFWDADWGIAKIIGEEKIWQDSLRGIIQSDIAIKLKSENPTLPNKDVLEQSIELAKKSPYKKWAKIKKIFKNQVMQKVP